MKMYTFMGCSYSRIREKCMSLLMLQRIKTDNWEGDLSNDISYIKEPSTFLSDIVNNQSQSLICYLI